MSFILPLEEIEEYCKEYVKRRKDNSRFFMVNATINGYHHFQIRPLIGFDMLMRCVLEPQNRYDENSIKLVVPPLHELKLNTLDLVVRDRTGALVRNVAGTMAGRMPRVMSKVVCPAIKEGQITSASAVYIGSLKHGPSLLGDGPKLNCFYFFEVDSIENENKLKKAIMDIHENSVILDIHENISFITL